MELLIRQRVFSWTDAYDVYDETFRVKYFVKAEFFSFGHQIHLYDKRTGEELGSIHQKLFALLPTFEIVLGGRSQGLIRKKFTFFSEKYELEYMGWNVDGGLPELGRGRRFPGLGLPGQQRWSEDHGDQQGIAPMGRYLSDPLP